LNRTAPREVEAWAEERSRAPGPGRDVEVPGGRAGHGYGGSRDGQWLPDIPGVRQVVGVPTIAEKHVGRGATSSDGDNEGDL